MKRTTPSRLAGLVLVLLACVPLRADVEGTLTAAGRPVEGAVVTDVASGTRAVTDARGRFHLRGVERPLTVRVEDPRFESLTAPLERAAEEPSLVLTPKQAVFESIVVTARPGDEAVAPVSVSATSVARDELPAPAGTLAEMALAAPGVAEAGQGGRFQAYSVRGVAGQRVLTTVAGMRIVTERRAGASASFVDPSLLGSVEVVRGPASTFYGSGALGGLIQALPRRLAGTEVEAGYAGQGDESSVFAGWGGAGFTLAAAGRDANDGETGDGAFLFNHSTQASGLLRKEWARKSWAFDFLALPAVARDIAKPNTRYPSRVTQYPEENHLLARFGAQHRSGWRLAVFTHPNDLETENLRATSRSLVTNEALDFGADAQRAWEFGNAGTAHLGVEYFGRHAVTASEVLEDFVAGTVERSRTLDGREDQVSVFGSVRRPLGRATLEAGARVSGIGQENLGASSRDVAGAGFVGATVPLRRGFELAANVGSGIRFPSLSERFFTGSTGRGEVIANQDLRPERSLSADVGVRYFGSRLFAELFVFQNAIDDYVEQAEIAPGVDSFINLSGGTIEGFDHDGWYAVTGGLKLTWSATSLGGTSDDGADLAEIPGRRASFGARYDRGAWRAASRVEQRLDKDDPGPAEVAIDSATLLSASVAYRASQAFELRVWSTNLLDETYRPSADELAVPGPGRSVGLTVRFISP